MENRCSYTGQDFGDEYFVENNEKLETLQLG